MAAVDMAGFYDRDTVVKDAIPSIVAYAYSNTLATVGSDPVSDTLISDLTVTFILNKSTPCLITASVRYGKIAGTARITIYDANAVGISTTPWYPGAPAPFDNSEVVLSEIRVLAAGQHTINIRESAALNTNTIKFGERMLTVEALI